MRREFESISSTMRRHGLELHPGSWRLIPPIETYPRVVEFAGTLAGRLLLIAIFAVFMRVLGGHLWLWITGAAAVVSFAGQYRNIAALLCTGVMLARAPGWFEYRAVYFVAEQEGLLDTLGLEYVRAATLLACVPIAAGSIWLVRQYRHHPLARRPVVIQHLLLFCLFSAAASDLFHGIPRVLLWSLLTVLAAYFWYLAYALIDQRHRNPSGLLLQLATFHPFYGSTTSPWGKGAAYWRSVESQTREELAVTQLKALKLIVWAMCLRVGVEVYQRVIYGAVGIPPLMYSFQRFVRDGIDPGVIGALTIVADYFEQLLLIAAWGNVIIATARLAGFRLLRNTCRPLSSRTIAEFWNRFDYYFKELLVNVYFYPTYLRFFKRHPRLRTAFATFMAAGVGNLLFHFMQENHRIPRDGLLETLLHMQTYAFYCAVLVCGIVISQLRNKRPDPDAGWLRRQFLPSLKVATFYCFLSFFDGSDTSVELSTHFAFLLHVLGVH